MEIGKEVEVVEVEEPQMPFEGDEVIEEVPEEVPVEVGADE